MLGNSGDNPRATVDEVIHNLQEAVQLHLEDENLAEIGLAPDPSILVTMELEPVFALAAPPLRR